MTGVFQVTKLHGHFVHPILSMREIYSSGILYQLIIHYLRLWSEMVILKFCFKQSIVQSFHEDCRASSEIGSFMKREKHGEIKRATEIAWISICEDWYYFLSTLWMSSWIQSQLYFIRQAKWGICCSVLMQPLNEIAMWLGRKCGCQPYVSRSSRFLLQTPPHCNETNPNKGRF